MSHKHNDQWVIGVDAAMICDEWYPDFYVGQVIDFAVMFYSPSPRKFTLPRFDKAYLEPSDDDVVHAEIVDDFDYIINGKAVYAGEAGWVVDVGILAATRSKPTVSDQPADWTKVGEFVRGRTFLLAEWAETGGLRRDPAAPAFVYTWRVDRIQMWDEQAGGYTDEQSTNAWMEVELGRLVSYQLTCTRLDVGPKRVTTRFEKKMERNRVWRRKMGVDASL